MSDPVEQILIELQYMSKRIRDLETRSWGAMSDFDGWISPPETWIYVSSSSIKVYGDKTDVYERGDRIKLVQSSGTGYFVVVSVSYGSSYTTLSLFAGIDYVVYNETITEAFYSKYINPGNFPQSFDWGGTSGLNAQGFSSLTYNQCYVQIVGRLCFVRIRIEGTSNSTGFTATLPLESLYAVWTTGEIRDSGVYAVGKTGMTASSSTLQIYPSTGAGTTWTNSGAKALLPITFCYFY